MVKRAVHDAVIAAPFGRLGIRLADGRLADIAFLDGRAALRAPKDAAARRVCHELRTYLRNPKHKFRVPLVWHGSRFQRRVWRTLRRIPAGQPLSYGALARRLKTGPRAVGNACRANPVPIVVPCHRVVAANGKGGFMGRTGGRALAIKDWLLAHERSR